MCRGIFEALDHTLRAVEPRGLHADELHGHELHNVAAPVPHAVQANGYHRVIKGDVREVPGDLAQHVAEVVALVVGCAAASVAVTAESSLSPVLRGQGKLRSSLYES